MRISLFIFILLLLAPEAKAQRGTIELKNEKSTYQTSGFIIKNVIDARKDTSAIVPLNGPSAAKAKKW